jgi:hypothetical protein
MDIVVVDDLYRQPLGKPYLTLATDVATRCILGFVISFVPPGAGTVSLCLTTCRRLQKRTGCSSSASPATGQGRGCPAAAQKLRDRNRSLGLCIALHRHRRKRLLGKRCASGRRRNSGSGGQATNPAGAIHGLVL